MRLKMSCDWQKKSSVHHIRHLRFLPSLCANTLRCLPFLFALLCFAGSQPSSFDERFRQILETSSDAKLYRLFHEMPKGGILHLHSEYAVPPEFWLKIATDTTVLGGNEYFTNVREGVCANGMVMPLPFTTIQRASLDRLSSCVTATFKPLNALSTEERTAWIDALLVNGTTGGRKQFFHKIVPRLDELWQDPNLMLEVIPAIMKAASSEHVLYLEVQFDPTSLHDAAGHPVSPDMFVQRLKKRLCRPDVSKTGVTIRFQMAAFRYAVDQRAELANAFSFVDKHRDLWVGVNLLGEEGQPGGELSRFAPAFREMRARFDIPFSLHAGEVDSPGREVHEALVLGAARIGHAVNLISDPDTMLLMRHGGVPIETSLVSNKLLEYTPDLAMHPFPQYLRSGIPMCLNTDDPGAWGGSLTDEFFLAAKLYHLSWKEVHTLVENSIQYAFLDAATKTRLLDQVHRQLNAFERRVSLRDWDVELAHNPSQTSEYAKRYLHLEH